MDTTRAFQDKFNALLKEYNQTKNEVLTDGTIDYGESLVVRDFLTRFGWEMERLKVDLVTGIANLRESYRKKTLAERNTSDDADAILRLRQEYRAAFEQHERMIEQVDFWLVQIPEERRNILDLIDKHETQANAMFENFETVAFNDDLLDAPHVKAELTRLTNQWRNLLKNIDQTPGKPMQEAYNKGVRRALELAINDITRLLDTLD